MGLNVPTSSASGIGRRAFLSGATAAGALAALGGCAHAQEPAPARIVRNDRIKQGLWRVNFGVGFGDGPQPFTVEEMCQEASRLGAHGFDLLSLDDIPTLERHDLKLLLTGMANVDFLTGLIHAEVHDDYVAAARPHIAHVAALGVPAIAVNAGQLRGLSYAEAADNAVALLTRVAEPLEEHGVVLCIENVNDRRAAEPSLGREDMAFGNWEWGMDVVERVDSPNVTLLCDLYHLQIMDGDVERHIRDSIHRIGHMHVAGVPTRAEIDDTQELNFRYLAEVIASLDYDGYVSHEWRPSPGRDPLESLAQAMAIMDV